MGQGSHGFAHPAFIACDVDSPVELACLDKGSRSPWRSGSGLEECTLVCRSKARPSAVPAASVVLPHGVGRS